MSGGGANNDPGADEGWGKYYRAAAQYIPAGIAQNPDGPPRERGTRRKKLMGYVQAANEIRQGYMAGYNNRAQVDNNNRDWPQMGIAQNTDGRLILFPSYARMRPISGNGQPEQTAEAPDVYHEDWKLEEGQFNELDAIIEVDVRGWLYYPQSGQLSRKSRYALWVARQLCGLPAQATDPTTSGDDALTPEEAEDAKRTAEAIANSGPASGSPAQSQTNFDGSATPTSRWGGYWRSNGDPNQQQNQLSPEQVKEAHAAFTARMAPFTYRPIADVPVTVFFYNDATSQARSIVTAPNGHFSLRAQLPFIPTHVKVLASETLSATEEICLHPPDGISLISDIDDTVKHSAISLGMREVFRNTFTAPLPTLSIPGVGQWYKKLAGHPYNVSMHYISNSPWQLYPLLKSFFQEAGLPPGSFHLKQYSGVFQGIFEPAADRKKGTVERVITDFPHRKWILVGDSGEADLEVYTEVAERWPDKILAVCIRDVTTPPSNTGYFDPNRPYGYPQQSRPQQTPPQLPARPGRQDTDGVEMVTPQLPPRPSMYEDRGNGPADFPRPSLRSNNPYSYNSFASSNSTASAASTTSLPETPNRSTPPVLPSKPANLRSPPVPPKPASLSRTATQYDPSASSTSLNSSLYNGSGYPSPPRRANTDLRNGGPPPPQRIATDNQPQQGYEQVNKKEEIWKRRWENAQERLQEKGVKLVAWRVGSDVEELTCSLVEREMKLMKGQ